MRVLRSLAILIAAVVGLRVRAEGQALSRREAIAAAMAHSPRLAAARADTAAAAARITTASALPDPTLAASYTKDIPRYHVTLEMPVDAIWDRGSRVASAQAGKVAAQYRQQYEIAAVTFDVDTSYTRALLTAAHADLSRRNAADADSLQRIAAAREAAGDASELEVQLATITAGQQASIAAADSVAAAAALLDLGALLGMAAGPATLADSLTAPPALGMPTTTHPIRVASDEAALQAATLNVKAQHRAAFGSPGIFFGFDAGDPTGDERGVLPTFGFTLPVPLFNRNRGPIAEAAAEEARAVATLDATRTESSLALAHAQGDAAAAASRLGRDWTLLDGAIRVAALSLTAYREGAAPLANVIEGQRAARDVQAQYVDDVAALLNATATLRLLTLAPGATP